MFIRDELFETKIEVSDNKDLEGRYPVYVAIENLGVGLTREQALAVVDEINRVLNKYDGYK